MKTATRNLLAFLLLAGMMGVGAMAQNTIQVFCYGADKPLKDVVVSLQDLSTSTVTEDKTDKKGKAEFKKLPDGVYRVYAKAEGYEPEFKEFLELSGGQTTDVRLDLKPGDSAKLLYFQDPQANQKLSDLIVAGANAYQENKFDEAEAKLKEAIELNPSSPDAYQNLAVIQLQARKFEASLETLKKTADLLRIYTKIFASSPQGATMQQRLDAVNELIEKMPLQRLSAEGDDALRTRDFKTAIAKYKAMLEFEPDNSAVHYNLALAQAHDGQTAEAKKSVARALELKPDDPGFEKLKTQIEEIEKQGISLKAKEALDEIEKQLEAKKYQDALAKSKAILPEVPEEFKWSVHVFMARAEIGLDQPDAATASFQTALDMEPQKADLRREFANHLFKNGKIAQGIAVYTEALKIEGQPVASEIFKLGQQLSRQGNAEGAGLAYEKVVELDPAYSEAYYELGLYHYYDTKNAAKAKAMLTKFIELGGDASHVDNANAVLQVLAKKK